MSKIPGSMLGRMNSELARLIKTSTLPYQLLTSSTNIQELRNRVVQEDRRIRTRDEESILIRIHRPALIKQTEGGRPLMVYFHGGGYCLGDIESDIEQCRSFVKDLGGVAVNVDYRLAPQHKFPIAINDCFDALKWVAENLDGLGAPVGTAKGFLIGGISAGGTMCTTLSHLYRDYRLSSGSHLPPLTGTFISIFTCIFPPVPIPPEYAALHHVESPQRNKDSPLIGLDAITMLKAHYAPQESSPLASLLLFPSHASLPPAYVQVCGLDPNRDYGLLYAKVLEREGTDVYIDVFEGLPHGFWTMWKDADFTADWELRTKQGWEWLLQKSQH